MNNRKRRSLSEGNYTNKKRRLVFDGCCIDNYDPCSGWFDLYFTDIVVGSTGEVRVTVVSQMCYIQWAYVELLPTDWMFT